MSDFPIQHERIRSLAEAAFNNWAPEATLHYFPMQSGYSGATVLKVDVSRPRSTGLESGQYLLKLIPRSRWNNTPKEDEAHDRVVKASADFALAHIPRLVHRFESPVDSVPGTALLFEIAGQSLDSFRAADDRADGNFAAIAASLARETLEAWADLEPSAPVPPEKLLEAWLGYRVDPEQAPELHALTSSICGERGYCQFGGHAVPNPFRLLDHIRVSDLPSRPYITGIMHGDLHGGNILVHRGQVDDPPWWIIDFGLSRRGPVGFDHAYLELALLLNVLGEADAAQMAGVLDALEYELKERLLPARSKVIVPTIRAMRGAWNDWSEHVHPRRGDDVARQLQLARIAAGLVWANRPLEEALRLHALCYAGWAARGYLEAFEPDMARKFWNVASAAERPSSKEADESLWQEVWARTYGFDPTAARFVLVAERQPEQDALQALGQLPWSVIIDLDPCSDEGGIRHAAGHVLESHRSLHEFSTPSPGAADFRRGTAWMMACGWSRKKEPQSSYDQWSWQTIPTIRSLFSALESAVHPEPVVAVLLPGAPLEESYPAGRLTKVAEAIAESTRNRSTILLLGSRGLTQPVPGLVEIPLESSGFVDRIAQAFGTRASSLEATVPGPDREPRAIPIATLRTLEENLSVLHSEILKSTPPELKSSDVYLRGHPPGVLDLHRRLDVERSIHEDLTEAARKALNESRSRTIILRHHPGAGGTTTALRVAWELRLGHPVAVLHTNSPALAERLATLFHIAERPIFVVADSATLPEAQREDLFRETAQRNVRVILLYVRHFFGDGVTSDAEDDAERPARTNEFELVDPLDPAEAEQFLEIFSRQTDDPRRLRELQRITVDEALTRYRSPFFYGLMAFERDFVGAEGYVRAHLGSVRRKPRELLQYLALVTLYSNASLHINLLRRLAGLSDGSRLPLQEIVGERPARLIIEKGGGARLIHQVIAEEAMMALTSGEPERWRLDLRDIATDFIEDIAACTPGDAELVVSMLRQLFTERYGGVVDGVEDRRRFSPLIEDLDAIDRSLGHRVFEVLTECFDDPHLWNHRGRHQIYRMERDLDEAERCLLRATKLSPNDYLHFHTLGLVRRYRVRDMLRNALSKTPGDILGMVQEAFAGAVEAFQQSRDLNPENIYTYITQVQLIVDVAGRLKEAAGVADIAEVDDSTGAWLADQLTVADSLLETAQGLYGTLHRDDTFLESCKADIMRLYGDLDRVVQIWERAEARRTPSAITRRALAHAYLARHDRRASRLNPSEIARVVTLMELNLRSSGRRGGDYTLWFEAYRLSPNFQREEAISRLRLWYGRDASWQAHYYTYVLHFLAWWQGATKQTDEMRAALSESERRVIGRKSFSPLWLGQRPTACPLVAAADLGRFSRAHNFWTDPSPLRRINGVIDNLNGPQAGSVLIDGCMRAFFVPGTEFRRYQDENRKVSFFLGFSPVGLRAWSVERGWVEDGDRHATPEEVPAVLDANDPLVSDARKRALANSLRDGRVVDFVRDIVQARTALGAEVRLIELAHKVGAVFSMGDLLSEPGLDAFEELVGTAGFELVSSGGEALVRQPAGADRQKAEGRDRCVGKIVHYELDEHWGFINDAEGSKYWFATSYIVEEDRDLPHEAGQAVSFVPSRNQRGPTAVGIRLRGSARRKQRFDEMEDDRFRLAVMSKTVSTLDDAPGRSLAMPKLLERLQDEFAISRGLKSRLGVSSYSAFFGSIDGVSVRGRHPRITVRLEGEGDVGLARRRPPDPRKAKSSTDTTGGGFEQTLGDVVSASGTTKPEPRGEALEPAEVADAARRVLGKLGKVRVGRLMRELESKFPGDSAIIERLGQPSIRRFLRSIEGVEQLGSWVRLAQAETPLALVTRLVQQAGDEGILLAELGNQVSRAIPGDEPLKRRLGGVTVRSLVRQAADISLIREANDLRAVSTARGDK